MDACIRSGNICLARRFQLGFIGCGEATECERFQTCVALRMSGETKIMSSYAFWNNKGGVGKSFLCFITASEYAHRHPECDVYVLDLCPQANVSETLLGG